MTDRKHPTAGFWITVALGAMLVGYPVSFGPWLLLCNRADLSTAAYEGWGFYAPVSCIGQGLGPTWICGPYTRYLDWWIAKGVTRTP